MKNYKSKKYNYVYTLVHVETKEFYHGSRSCDHTPEKDYKYLGSFKKWKPDKSKLQKTIIKNFNTRNEAFILEREMIIKDISNPLNRNYMIPNTEFHFLGKVIVKDKEGKRFVISKADEKYISGEYEAWSKGENNGMHGRCNYDIWLEKHGKEIADKKWEEFKIQRKKSTTGKNNPMYGKSVYDVWVKRYGKQEADKLMKLSNKKNRQNNLGNKNGMHGRTIYDVWLEKYGKQEADDRMEEYRNSHRLIGIQKDGNIKLVKPDELQLYLNKGWIKGYKGLFCHIYNPKTGEKKYIRISESEKYFNSGWKRGQKSKNEKNEK